ncbi:MAG: hypothetical protein QOE99_1424, partial [Actinomycetota bacterium]|nr:hypothetical protein [Actinomycetota bacterium]
MRLALVVNPRSGKGRAAGAADITQRRLESAGVSVRRLQGVDGD